LRRVLEGAQQGFGICAIAAIRLIGKKFEFVLQQRPSLRWLSLIGEMPGQIAGGAQGKSALAALVGECQRSLEVPISLYRIMDIRVRDEAPFEA